MLGKKVRVESSTGTVTEFLVVAERLDGFVQVSHRLLAAKNKTIQGVNNMLFPCHLCLVSQNIQYIFD